MVLGPLPCSVPTYHRLLGSGGSYLLRLPTRHLKYDRKAGEPMPTLRDVYGNSGTSGYTVDFFTLTAPGAKSAYLACPFFSTYEPIQKLTAQGCKVRLIVRLCSITPPPVLRRALDDKLVTIRYFTSRDFHAKLYIVDGHALVGSANLTGSGLYSNREISVVLQKDRDPAFDSLPGLFNLFWDFGDVLNEEVLAAYTQAFRKIGLAKEEKEFEEFLTKLVPAAAPPTARVGSDLVSAKRSFLQSLRRKYDEELLPAYAEVRELFSRFGRRRPEYAAGDLEIELNRFLGWSRLVHAPGDSWKQAALIEAPARALRIEPILQQWHAAADVGEGDMVDDSREVERITRLRQNLRDAATIEALGYEELFETLIACHAFYDTLRFVSGGLEGLRREFASRNSLKSIKETLVYLLHGEGVETGIDLDALVGVAVWLGEVLEERLPGQVHRAGVFAPVAG